MFGIRSASLVLLAATLLQSSNGFQLPHQQQRAARQLSLCATPSGDEAAAGPTTRRDLFDRTSKGAVAAAALLGLSTPRAASAFDGSGASASAGYSPATKAEKKKKFQERIVADVKDFNTLGQAIDKGETQGPAWVNFFILFQRREPDEVGRTYAALADMRGLPTKKSNEFEGGGGLLLANTFTKQGKPPDNTPAVKSFLKLSKTFDAIEAAGKAGDAKKAKTAWVKTSEMLSQYLSDVELPGDLKDALYKP